MTNVQLELFGAEKLGPDPRIGCQPATPYEWSLLMLLARAVPVPEHPSSCASVPGCWHGLVWHRPGVRRSHRHCEVPGCECLCFVEQVKPTPPWRLARNAPPMTSRRP